MPEDLCFRGAHGLHEVELIRSERGKAFQQRYCDGKKAGQGYKNDFWQHTVAQPEDEKRRDSDSRDALRERDEGSECLFDWRGPVHDYGCEDANGNARGEAEKRLGDGDEAVVDEDVCVCGERLCYREGAGKQVARHYVAGNEELPCKNEEGDGDGRIENAPGVGAAGRVGGAGGAGGASIAGGTGRAGGVGVANGATVMRYMEDTQCSAMIVGLVHFYSLRWYYPDQVKGRSVSSSQPRCYAACCGA